MNAKITLVPSPIGNLEDITLRSLRYIKEADLIAAEDTRKTSFLLNHFGVKKELLSLHAHNEHKRLESLLNRVLAEDLHLLVMSDAGTPGISDPGYLTVRFAIDKGIPVEVLPGPAALIPALVLSGLPTESFCFEGFLPTKKGRKKKLESLANEKRTMIFYESPYRIPRTLKDFAEIFGSEREVSVSRELTKLHEETVRGTLAELVHHYEERKPRGEYVIVVKGGEK